MSWDNTMVSAHWYDDNKHWKREAKCFGLAEVFSRFNQVWVLEHGKAVVPVLSVGGRDSGP